MTDQNIKFKTTAVAPKPDQNDDKKDIFQTHGPEKPNIGPGSSEYKPGNAKTSQWKAVSGGTAKSMMDPFAVPEGGVIGELGEWCADTNQEMANKDLAYKSDFVPRTVFDHFRTKYESPDFTKQFDLKTNLPEIPSFGEIYNQINDLSYIKRFFVNRLKMVKDMIVSTKEEIRTSTDYRQTQARHEFHVLLQRKQSFIERQLAELNQRERSEIS